MNQLYEVNIMACSMKTFYVSAETAEDAGKIAEVLCNSGVVNIKKDMDVRVEAASVNSSDYYEGHIKETGLSPIVPVNDKCKDFILFGVYNSIGNVSIEKG